MANNKGKRGRKKAQEDSVVIVGLDDLPKKEDTFIKFEVSETSLEDSLGVDTQPVEKVEEVILPEPVVETKKSSKEDKSTKKPTEADLIRWRRLGRR